MQKLTLIKYGHEHCQPCRSLKPILDELTLKYANHLEFIDRDTYTMSVEELTAANIRAVPSMVLVQDGKIIWNHVGFLDKASLEAVINQVLEPL
jgi:thioredoxin 1